MKYYKYCINLKWLNIICSLLFIPLLFLVYIMNIYKYMDFMCFILYFFWMFIHEFLHGIGFSLNKSVNNNKIVYGACLEKGIFYCMCKDLISKNGIIVSLLFPFFFIGVFTFFIGLIINNSILILLSLFNIVGSIGDLIMFFSFYKLPDFNYLDLDDCDSFVLVSNSDLSNYKLFCMDLVEVGEYSNLEFSHNYKKITVSKFSFLIFVLLIVLLVLNFFM